MKAELPYALVTGSSRGIGASIARALARDGYPVLVNYIRNEAAAAEVCASIAAEGGIAEPIPFDVTDREAVHAALDFHTAQHRHIGVLVNNAGLIHDSPFPVMSFQDWTEVTRTTLDGFYNLTQHLIMPMVRRRWGRVINISSVSGLIGVRGQVNYAAAKAGLIGATRALAQEVARRGVTVNAVAPGLIDTEMIAGIDLEIALKLIPMRRLGKPEEVANLVSFLVGDGAAYITGQVLGVNGGLA